MVSGSAKINSSVSHMPLSIPIDPRYQNDEFRMLQAKRYLDFFQGTTELSKEEHNLIPQLCYWEIRKVQAWNNLTKVEQGIFKICNPFFSRIPNDTQSVVRIFGASVITLGSLLVSAYIHNNKVVCVTFGGYLLLLYREMYLK